MLSSWPLSVAEEKISPKSSAAAVACNGRTAKTLIVLYNLSHSLSLPQRPSSIYFWCCVVASLATTAITAVVAAMHDNQFAIRQFVRKSIP